MVKMMWEPTDFASVKTIFHLFHQIRYSLGDSQPVINPYIFGDMAEGSHDFHVWLLLGDNAILDKSWRHTLNDEVGTHTSSHVLLYTEDFSEFQVGLISEGINIEIKFMLKRRFNQSMYYAWLNYLMDDLNMHRPLTDPRGIKATIDKIKRKVRLDFIEGLVLTIFPESLFIYLGSIISSNIGTGIGIVIAIIIVIIFSRQFNRSLIV